MKKLIFDLDGTLWETGDGYVYSYNKACQQLNIPLEKRQGPDYVKAYLGVKLEELVQTIIPEAPDKQQLGLILLSNVIEYQLKNPKTCSKNILSLFENLSEEWEIYIISNCPRPFLDAFYTISGVKKYVTGDNTIEDSNKITALKKITHDYSEKALFIGDSSSDYDSIENHQMVQFVYASYGYSQCDSYNLKISDLDLLPELLEKFQDQMEILKNEKYEIISENNSSVIVMEKEKAFYFGFMKIENPEDLTQIIKKMQAKYSSKSLLGPVDKNSWYNYRIALNEFDFKLYPDCLSDEAVLNKFYENGFKVCDKYTSTVTYLNRKLWKKDKKIKIGAGYEILLQKGTESFCRLDQIFQISSRCFSDHDYFEPINHDEFIRLYEKNLSSIEPVLILILYKGEPVGFNFGYPDPEKRFFVDKTFAIDKKHRSSRILLKMIEVTSEIVEEMGFDKVLFHFQNEKLRTMQSYFKGLVIRQKEYGVLKYERD